MVKQLRQVAGVRQVKVVDFKKGIFSVTPRRGVVLSQSALSEAVRRSGFTVEKIVAPGGSPRSKLQGSPRPPLPGNQAAATTLDEELAPARDAFRKRKYDVVVELVSEVEGREISDPKTDQAPNKKDGKQDEKTFVANARIAEIQQLLSLAYFGQGKYQEAFTSSHVALHRGTPWNWKHLSGHYEKPKEYSTQLRALEQRIREKPSVEMRFLVGYHYLMLGYTKAAHSQLTRVANKKPDDALVRGLLRQLEKKPRLKTP